jgi:bloom syndrome protein
MPLGAALSGGRPNQQRSEYPSTAVTSPLAPSSRKTQPIRYGQAESDSDDEPDAFEPLKTTRRKRPKSPQRFGPRITSDDRMAALTEEHRVVIQQFVEEAKKLEEKIRNKSSAKKPIFTEASLREMAILWTVTLEEMRAIPDINVDAVGRHGTQFLQLVRRYQTNFNAMMEPDDDHDMDMNHQNVIDLVTDGEEEEDDEDVEDVEDDFEMNPGLENAIAEAERSRYFGADQGTSKGKGRASRGSAKNGFKGARKGKKYAVRKSVGSASGQSNAGVSKRTLSGSSRGSRGSRGARGNNYANTNLARSFSRGGGGGVIDMMPP